MPPQGLQVQALLNKDIFEDLEICDTIQDGKEQHSQTRGKSLQCPFKAVGQRTPRHKSIDYVRGISVGVRNVQTEKKVPGVI